MIRFTPDSFGARIGRRRYSRICVVVLGLIIPVTALLRTPVGAQQPETRILSASANSPDIVKVGESVSFTITLDKAPNFKGGTLVYWILGPDNGSVVSGVTLEPGKSVYILNFQVPAGAPGGTWKLNELKVFTGFGQAIPLKFKAVPFQVIPDSSLIFPTTAEAKINPSQLQLLRREALNVQARIQVLKANVVRMQEPAKRDQLIGILRGNLNDGLEAVQRTERSFTELGAGQSTLEAGRVFFADLRASYRQALQDLASIRGQVGISTKFLIMRFVRLQGYPALAQGPLRVLEQNVLAYSVVATKGDLTFDLEVNSAPQGATVFFWRRGDSQRKNSKPTNSVIPALPYAIWLVRFQVPGYRDEEREHDPFREANHVVSVEMHKQ